MRISSVLENNSQRDPLNFKAKPIPNELAQSFKNQLLSNNVKTVDIFCHSSPDEDTVNAMKVMYNWLKRNGKKARACLDISDTAGLYLNKFFYHFKTHSDEKEPADKSLCVDFNGMERIPKNYDLFESKLENIIGFDHHVKSKTTIPSSNMYIDESASSCCGVIYRYFEQIGEDLSTKDLKSLYCGLLSDYRGSKLIDIKKSESELGYDLIKHKELLEDKNSLEILDKIERSLSDDDKKEIYHHLDILSRLNSNEKLLMENLAKEVSISQNIAYIFIEPNDSAWSKVGFDNVKTSAILKDIRTRVMENRENDELFSPHQKKAFKKIKAIAIFYRVNGSENSDYQVSVHSKEGYAEKLIEKVIEKNPDFIGGGHPDRGGGRINSCEYDNAVKLVNDFLEADEIISSEV